MEQDAQLESIRQLRETLAENVSGELDKVKQELQDDLEQNNERLRGEIEGLLAGLRDEVVDTIKDNAKASAESLDAISKRDADLYGRIDAALTIQGKSNSQASTTSQDVSDELHKLNEMFAILFGLAEKALSAAADTSSASGQASSPEIRELSNQISDLRRAVEARGGATGVAVTGDSSAVSRQLSDLSTQISRLGDRIQSAPTGSSTVAPQSSSSGDITRLRDDISRISQRQLDSNEVRDIVDAAKKELLSALEGRAQSLTPSGGIQTDERLVDAKVRAAIRDVQKDLEATQAENMQMKNQMERSRTQSQSHWDKIREERESLEFQKMEFSKLRQQVMQEIEQKRAELGATPRNIMQSALEREKQIVIETRKRLEAERQIVEYERKRLEERSRDYQTMEIEDEGRKQYNKEVKRLMEDLVKQTDIAERNKIELESSMRTIQTQNKQMALMKQRLAMQRDALEMELGRSSATLMDRNGSWDQQRVGLEKKLVKMGQRMNRLRQENTHLRGETPKNSSGSEMGGTPLYGAQNGTYITTPGI